jgi:hypothetical protein
VEKEVTKNGKTVKQRFPIYFVLKVLTGSKRYYSEMEKICYAIIMSFIKLHHYFEAHTIKVLIKQRLNDIFGNRDSLGRITKWAMELSEQVVDFEKRSVIKLQIITDFVAEWMQPGSYNESIIHESTWLIYCDRVWGNARAGAPSMLIAPSEIKLCYVARLQLTKDTEKCTNNIVEYEVVLLGLHKLRAIGVERCVLRTNSKVVSSQIEKECITRERTLEKYLALIRRMENYFKGFIV